MQQESKSWYTRISHLLCPCSRPGICHNCLEMSRKQFDYIIALLEQTPGSPTLTFEKLYVMFTRVKKACKFQCLPLSPAFNKAKLYHFRPKILATKWRMDIGRDGYWKPHVINSSALSVPKILKAVAAPKK